jgi:putative nucleotide binding protein
MTTPESSDPGGPGDAGDADAGASETSDDEPAEEAVVLDYLAHGRADDDRPRYEKSPIAYALGVADLRLYELQLVDEADVGIGDSVVVEPAAERDVVESLRQVDYEELSNGARSELEYVVEDVVAANEGRFVDFYNDAQPITLRLHQLNLLPGIGKKLRNNILDQRKRGPFESFEDVEERVSGLHRPKEVLVERIIEELKDEDLKYRTFVGREAGSE